MIYLEKSIKTVESDLEREKSISLDADLNEKRVSKEKEDLLNTENKLYEVEKNSSSELQISKKELNKLLSQLDSLLDQIENEQDPKLLRMIDILGREQNIHQSGQLLFYIYDNGTVEKLIKY